MDSVGMVEAVLLGVEHIVRRKSPVDFSIWITYNKAQKGQQDQLDQDSNERCIISILVSPPALWRDRDVICRISNMHHLSKGP